jgi:hypothetical protein
MPIELAALGGGQQVRSFRDVAVIVPTDAPLRSASRRSRVGLRSHTGLHLGNFGKVGSEVGFEPTC